MNLMSSGDEEEEENAEGSPQIFSHIESDSVFDPSSLTLNKLASNETDLRNVSEQLANI